MEVEKTDIPFGNFNIATEAQKHGTWIGLFASQMFFCHRLHRLTRIFLLRKMFIDAEYSEEIYIRFSFLCLCGKLDSGAGRINKSV
jgi:hypothetical protein